MAITSYMAFSNQELFHKLSFRPYTIIREKQFYRFFTVGWVHADFMHLVFNMYVLYGFGNILESFFGYWFGAGMGTAYYVFLLLGSTVIAGIPSYAKHKDNYNYVAVGASGGVSGVLFATILIQPFSELSLFGIHALSIPGIFLGVLYLVYSHYMSKRGQDNIGHDAHFWGAIGGMLLVTLFKPAVLTSFLAQVVEKLSF